MDFSKKVLAVVSQIPRGQVMTYMQVAKAAGRPRAARAVGNILHRNPHPACGHPLPKGEGIQSISLSPRERGGVRGRLEIPCHRVVKSNGTIGGYVGGVAKKRALLKKEGVKI